MLDVSASISSDTYARIAATLDRLVRSNGSYGLILFSDTAYQALPPNTPARELRPLVRFFDAPRRRPRPARCREAPRSPWTDAFGAGTRISTGLSLALDVIREQRLRASGRAPRQRPRRRQRRRRPRQPGRDRVPPRRHPAARRRAERRAGGRGVHPRFVTAKGSFEQAALPSEQASGVVRQRRPALVALALLAAPRARPASCCSPSRCAGGRAERLADRSSAPSPSCSASRARARARHPRVATTRSTRRCRASPKHPARRPLGRPATWLPRDAAPARARAPGRPRASGAASRRSPSRWRLRGASTTAATRRSSGRLPSSRSPTSSPADRRRRRRGPATCSGSSRRRTETADDPAADERRAAETFEAAIRADPANVDAKHNLELLLRRIKVVGIARGRGRSSAGYFGAARSRAQAPGCRGRATDGRSRSRSWRSVRPARRACSRSSRSVVVALAFRRQRRVSRALGLEPVPARRALRAAALPAAACLMLGVAVAQPGPATTTERLARARRPRSCSSPTSRGR